MIGTNETAAAANLKAVQDRQQIRSPLIPQQVSTTPAAIQNVSIPADQKADKPDVGEELDNDLYSVNGVAFYYYDHPIQLKVNEPQRVYLVNMLDFEENSFHMHGNLFEYYPSGTALNPILKNDMITLQQGDRGILEFTYPYVGKYMIHAHLDQVGGRGWMGAFDVVK
jgi:FtsP/CotA-like multicopper oxidase with cupredoxin domain